MVETPFFSAEAPLHGIPKKGLGPCRALANWDWTMCHPTSGLPKGPDHGRLRQFAAAVDGRGHGDRGGACGRAHHGLEHPAARREDVRRAVHPGCPWFGC